MRRSILALGFACAALLLWPRPVNANGADYQPRRESRTTIALSQFGYVNDVSFNGPSPQFQFHLPIYPQLRTIEVHIPLELSPVVDGRATINVKVNGQSIYSRSLGTAHRLTLNLPVPIPAGARTVTITVGAVLFHHNDICGQIDNESLWMRVGNRSTVTLALAPVRRQSIADFLNDYGGRFNVVLSRQLGESQRYAALRLAYALHASNRWRSKTVTFSDRSVGAAPNVVFALSSRDMYIQGNSLYVSPAGLPLLTAELAKLQVTTMVSRADAPPAPSGGPGQATLRDLGIADQTMTGDDELPVHVPLNLGRLGGTPSHLRLHVDMTHTPLGATDRGQLKVYLNGSLADAFELARGGGAQHFDAPIDARLLESVNDVRVVPTYYSDRPCRGAHPTMTASVLNSSSFSWDGLTKEAPGIGNFFGSASGRVAVLLADRSLADAVFALLDKLGSINTSITSLDVQPYTGSIPAGYDYAIVVAPLDKIDGLDVPFKRDSAGFRIVDPADGRLLYSASYIDPFGVIQTTHAGTPALVVTYWKDSGVLRMLDRVSAASLADVQGNVLLFNAAQVEYKAGTVLRRPPQTAYLYLWLFIWLFAAVAVMLELFVVRALWRRRTI